MTCPHCDHSVDKHIRVNFGADDKPVVGAMIVCLYCCGVSVWTDVSGLRLMRAPLEELSPDLREQVSKAQAMVKQAGGPILDQ